MQCCEQVQSWLTAGTASGAQFFEEGISKAGPTAPLAFNPPSAVSESQILTELTQHQPLTT